jgi:rod shape-determining protein MreD
MIINNKMLRRRKVGKIIFLSLFLITFAYFLNSFLLFPFLFFPTIIIFSLFSFLYNTLEDSRQYEGYFVAIFSGFLVDIFSNMPVGFYSLIFFVFAYLLKTILRKYVRIPSFF